MRNLIVKLLFASSFLFCVFSFVVSMELVPSKMKMMMSLDKVEALADDENDKPKYRKVTDACTKEFTIDADGYVEIFGVKIKVAGVGVHETHKETFYDVKIECKEGNEDYECKDCSCAEFWLEKC